MAKKKVAKKKVAKKKVVKKKAVKFLSYKQINMSELVLMPIDEVIPWEGNPRKYKENIEQLKYSMERVGVVEPILVRKQNNMIVAGHKRWWTLKQLGYEKVPVIMADLSEKGAIAQAIFDNVSTVKGDWLKDKLKENMIRLEALEGDMELTGLNVEELEKLGVGSGSEGEGEEPEVVFSEFLEEESNYVVLKFNNQIDWLNALTILNLGTVTSRRQNGLPWSSGVGRVVDGVNALKLLRGE